MENYEPRREQDEIFSKRIKAGKRTYFIDVKPTRRDDYFITITESKKRYNEPGYDKHKLFIYKEDFNKFTSGLEEVIAFVKNELMPGYDFDKFNRNELEAATEDISGHKADKELSDMEKDFDF